VVESRDRLVAELQAEFADLPYSMTDELIAERRAEAAREELDTILESESS
jgi:hypothetical protein